MLIIGDPHIEERNLDELEKTFTEIYAYSDAREIICLGDYYHSKRPTPKELEFGTKWTKKFSDISLQFFILYGNHPAINEQESSINYLIYINDNIGIRNDLLIGDCYFAHKMTEKSEMYFGLGESTLSKYLVNTKDLKKYGFTFLGHQHKFQKIDENIYHVGSCIFNSFGELNHNKKYISLVTPEKVEFVELQSVIPMMEVFSINELDKVNQKTKVRLTIKSFDQFKKEINFVKNLKNKFCQFKLKLDFQKEITKVEFKKDSNKFKQLIENWLKNIKDEEIKQELKNEFGKI